MQKYSERALATALDKIISNLETRRCHYERNYGLYSIEEVSSTYVLSEYRRTLLDKELYGARTVEPLSSLWVDTSEIPATLEWYSEKQDIGEKITVKAVARIRKELDHVVKAWQNTNFEFGASGAIYHNVPNKSYKNIKQFHEHDEYKNLITNLNCLDEWRAWWPKAIAMRIAYSSTMLELKPNIPDIFSYKNREAGCAIKMRGRKLKRSDLDDMSPTELSWLLDIEAGSALMFAATAYAETRPGKAWLVTVQEPNVVGAIGARSDADIIAASYSDHTLTTTSEVTCRQIVADGGGVLCNGASERKIFGKSVAQMIWGDTIANTPKLHQPLDFQLYLEYLCTPTPQTAKPGEFALFTNDIGMMEPIKMGADQMFSKTFLRIGTKVVSELTSGKWSTSLQYLILQQALLKRSQGLIHDVIGIGDDFNARVQVSDFQRLVDALMPFVKLKGTKGNITKMLGFITARYGDIYEIFNNARIQKTESSAAKLSGFWKDLESHLQPNGTMTLTVPPEIEMAVVAALPIVKDLIYSKGDRRQLPMSMYYKWKAVDISKFVEYLPSWFKFNWTGEHYVG